MLTFHPTLHPDSVPIELVSGVRSPMLAMRWLREGAAGVTGPAGPGSESVGAGPLPGAAPQDLPQLAGWLMGPSRPRRCCLRWQRL